MDGNPFADAKRLNLLGLCERRWLEAHRAQASTNGVARFAPVACAGPLLVAELEALAAALQSPKRPLVAILGGFWLLLAEALFFYFIFKFFDFFPELIIFFFLSIH